MDDFEKYAGNFNVRLDADGMIDFISTTSNLSDDAYKIVRNLVEWFCFGSFDAYDVIMALAKVTGIDADNLKQFVNE